MLFSFKILRVHSFRGHIKNLSLYQSINQNLHPFHLFKKLHQKNKF